MQVAKMRALAGQAWKLDWAYKIAPKTKVWNGNSNVNMSLGKELPSGTYFYVIKLGNGHKEFTGFVVINR